MLEWSVNLTEKQKEIVEAPLGAMLVTAGAGSGKTRVLTQRIAWVIGNFGIKDYQVLALTFTNKAAKEMKNRVSDLLGFECGAFLGTFHSFCAGFLRRHIDKLSRYTKDFSIYDIDDSLKIIKTIVPKDEAKKYHDEVVEKLKSLELEPFL